MALTKISTGGVKDDAASQAKIADEAVDEARLQVSNTGSNGQFLQKQSGDTGGLTWATLDSDLVSDTTPQLGGDLDSNGKNIKLGDSTASPTAGFTNIDDRITFGTGDGTYPDLSIWSDGNYNKIQFAPGSYLDIGNTTTQGIFSVHPNNINLNKTVNVQDSDVDLRKSGTSKVLWDDSDTAIEFANDVKLTFNGSNGTSGQVLTSQGASAAPQWANASGDFKLLHTVSSVTAASSQELWNGFTDDYDLYKIVFRFKIPSGGGELHYQVGPTSGYITSGSLYRDQRDFTDDGTTRTGQYAGNHGYIGGNVKYAVGELLIYYPCASTSDFPFRNVIWNGWTSSSDSNPLTSGYASGSRSTIINTTNQINKIQVKTEQGGNITVGQWKVYGIN